MSASFDEIALLRYEDTKGTKITEANGIVVYICWDLSCRGIRIDRGLRMKSLPWIWVIGNTARSVCELLPSGILIDGLT